MQIFSPKYFARLSCELCASNVNLSPQNFGKFTTATIWRENKNKRHSYECCVTLSRMSSDCCKNDKENKLHLWERHTTSRDIFSKLDRNSRICGINVHSLRLQRESCVQFVNLCCKIVTNNSRTSLQLSNSSEIGALEL